MFQFETKNVYENIYAIVVCATQRKGEEKEKTNKQTREIGVGI